MESLEEVVWGRALPDYQLKYVSESAVNLYGFPLADWYENSNLWSDIIHPDEIKQVLKEGESLFTSGISELEFRIITPDKKIKWVHSTTRILKSADGTPFFMTGISRDITEEKKVQKQLNQLNNNLEAKAAELQISNSGLLLNIAEMDVLRAASEAIAKELRQFIETANAPIFGIDADGKVNEWNQTSEKITGFKKEEVLGKDLVETYITEDYRKAVKQVLDNALKGKETANYEFPLFTKDGRRVMVLLNSSTRRDVDGKIVGVLGVGQDISELDAYRTRTEAIAKELRQFIETANAPIFGIDADGKVNEWNQTSAKITGFKKEEVLGKDLVETYITEDYRKAVKQVLDNALKGKETANFEFPLFTKEGARVMVLLNSSTRRNAAGKITGVLGVGQDITELVGYRNDLELKVNQRTLKLNEALKKQKELNELKSRFVSTASHEFRTPLSAINFAAGSMKKYWSKMEPIMIEKKLDKIENQVLHMTKLLDDVLIVGQAEVGEIRNHPLTLNLGSFIDEIIEEVYHSSQKAKKIVLIDTKKLKNTDIFIDEKLGRNIFVNIISNAVKFSPDAHQVNVELSSEKDHTIISVTDFGIGIPESELNSIFMPFMRGKNVDLIQGTGLGLSIVKDAVSLIGGKILINSKVGEGTTFIVKIPKI
jgi:PAS domain S-box-containing protein